MPHRQQRKRKPVSEINVVPYIDVMLVLLVIFMITAPLLKQGIQVNLPRANRSALHAIAKKPIIISVDQQGFYYLNTGRHATHHLSEQQLKAALRHEILLETHSANRYPARHQRKIYIKGDRRVDYGAIVRALSLAKTAGARQVGLILSEKN